MKKQVLNLLNAMSNNNEFKVINIRQEYKTELLSYFVEISGAYSNSYFKIVMFSFEEFEDLNNPLRGQKAHYLSDKTVNELTLLEWLKDNTEIDFS